MKKASYKKEMRNRKTIYLMDDNDMRRLEELISEIQCCYLDIYSNRSVDIFEPDKPVFNRSPESS